MDYKEFYKKAYAIMGESTPLKTDCGVLCGSACCKGDENTGMLLFPGEPCSALAKKPAAAGTLCVCGGKCERETRPLSCRIFPFFPKITQNGRVKAVFDARALRLCPLLTHCDEIRFDSEFIKKIKKLGYLLSRDEASKAFLQEQNEEIEQYAKLLGFGKTYRKRKFR